MMTTPSDRWLLAMTLLDWMIAAFFVWHFHMSFDDAFPIFTGLLTGNLIVAYRKLRR